MTLNPKYFRRRSIRLKGYDYTQSGAYFVTICAHRLVNLFGEVVDGKMILNVLGRIVEEEWRETPEIRSYVDLDEYVVMPNHLHGIIMIVDGRRINRKHCTPDQPVWQRNYYEHIIRNDYSLNRIREYIYYNPQRWHLDRYNPEATGPDEINQWLDQVHV